MATRTLAPDCIPACLMGIPHISQSAAEPTEAAEAQAELPDAWITPRVLGTEWVLTLACDLGSQGRGHFLGGVLGHISGSHSRERTR